MTPLTQLDGERRHAVKTAQEEPMKSLKSPIQLELLGAPTHGRHRDCFIGQVIGVLSQ